MAIEFDCPNCQSRIRTPDEAAGKKARCPHCKQVASVPTASSSPLADFGRPPALAPLRPFDSFQSPAKPTPPANPAAAPNWLPPSSAFAPQGPPQPVYGSPGTPPGYSQPSYSQPGYSTPGSFSNPPPAAANPFGDPLAGSGSLNPYASPESASAYGAPPLTKAEARQRLLGPALGMCVGAALCLGAIAFLFMAVLVSPDFQADLNNPNQRDEVIAGMVVLFIGAVIAAIPNFLMLIGAYAMYRGRGVAAAWVGAIAALIPCNICFFVGAGFAIWGMVVLSDSRVSAAMK